MPVYYLIPERRFMTALDIIKRDTAICMFDLYGTVVDMQGGLTQMVKPYLEQKGWTGDPSRLVTWWRHPFRELHDRRAAAPGAYRVP